MDEDSEPERIQLHCSWCHTLCTQVMTERNVLIRSVYSCSHCQECVTPPSPVHRINNHAPQRHRLSSWPRVVAWRMTRAATRVLEQAHGAVPELSVRGRRQGWHLLGQRRVLCL
jgi:hypothetical protein